MNNQKTVVVEVIVDWNGNLDSHKNFQNLIKRLYQLAIDNQSDCCWDEGDVPRSVQASFPVDSDAVSFLEVISDLPDNNKSIGSVKRVNAHW